MNYVSWNRVKKDHILLERDNQLWVREPVVGVYSQQRSKLLPSTPQFQQLLKLGRRLSRTGKYVCHRMSVKNPPSVGCFLPQIVITCADVQTATRLWCVREGPAAIGLGQAESSPVRLEQFTASHSACQQEQVGLFYQLCSPPPPPGCPECRQQTT